MLLAIDIGNTNIVIGGIQDGRIAFEARIATDRIKTSDQYGAEIKSMLGLFDRKPRDVEDCIISSVVPPVFNSVRTGIIKVTGKAPMVGNRVSHANNKTKRRFMPNLQYRRFWVESENRWVRLRVTNAALRTIDKNGIEAVLADLRARGEI